MAINFPDSPVDNDEFTTGGITYKWNAGITSWLLVQSDVISSANANTIGLGANTYTNSQIAIVTSDLSNTTNIAVAAFEQANVGGNMDYPYVNAAVAGANSYMETTLAGANTAVGAGANTYATAVGTAGNTYLLAVIAGANTAVGTGANAYADSIVAGIGAGANAYADTATAGANAYMLSTVAGANTAVGTGANAYATAVGTAGNTYLLATIAGANAAVGGAANAYADAATAGANAYMLSTVAGANTAVGAGANAYTDTATAGANAYMLSTVAGANAAVGAGANAYATAVGTAGNTYLLATIAGANTAVGAGANAYADSIVSTAGSAANTYADSVGAGANSYLLATIAGANTAVGTGANAYADAATAGANNFLLATIGGSNTIAIAAFDKANTGGIDTDLPYTWTNTHTFSANVTLNQVILTANGTTGTPGQVITSNGNTVFWSTVSGGPGASVTISASAPGSPSSGDLWWNSDLGRLLIYYNDGDTSQWVDAAPTGEIGPTGATGPAGPKSLTITNPTASEDITLLYTEAQHTLTRVATVFKSIGTSTVGFTIRYDTDRSAAGTEVKTGGMTAESNTTANTVYTFDSAVIPANNFVWLETSSITGSVQEFHLSLTF